MMDKALDKVKKQVESKHNRTCPKCGIKFTCDIEAGKSDCWCFKELAGKTFQNLGYTTCLCKVCLKK